MFWTGTGPRVVKKWEISFVHKHNFLVCSFSLKYYLQLCFSSESFCVLVPKFNLNGKKCIPVLSSVCAGKSLPVSKLNSGGCLSLDIFSKSTKASQSFQRSLGTLTTNSMGSLALLLKAFRIMSTACWWVTPCSETASTDTNSNPAWETEGDPVRHWQNKCTELYTLIGNFIRYTYSIVCLQISNQLITHGSNSVQT